MLDDLTFQVEPKEVLPALKKDFFKGVRGGEWLEEHWIWGNYASLIDLSTIDLDASIDVVKRRAYEGLALGPTYIQAGLVSRWLSSKAQVLRNPTAEDVERHLALGDVAVLCDFTSGLYRRLETKLPEEAKGMTSAVYLEDPASKHSLFLFASSLDKVERLHSLFTRLKDLFPRYCITKGWPLCTSGEYMVTPLFNHPLSLVSRALRQCCQWFFLIGPHENLTLRGLVEQLSSIGLEFVALSGQFSSDGSALLLGLDEYPNFQDSPVEKCMEWRKTKGGLIFLRFESIQPPTKLADFDGLLFNVGNSEYIEDYDKPFLVFDPKFARRDVPSAMVLLVERDKPLSKDTVINAITRRNCVGISNGSILGSKDLVEVFWLLVLERKYLENLFSSKVSLETKVVEDHLHVELRNLGGRDVKGKLGFTHPKSVRLRQGTDEVILKGGESRSFVIPADYGLEACGTCNAIGTTFDFHEGMKRDVAYVNIPEVISTYSQRVMEAGESEVEATLFNYTCADEVSVKYEVLSKAGLCAQGEARVKVQPKRLCKVLVGLKLEPGSYELVLSALNARAFCNLIVVAPQGSARAVEKDLGGSKVVVLENDLVRATVIPVGGRLIDYVLKDSNASLLFKLWPKKPLDWRSPGRKLRFWPYGGLEEFIQQPTVETHEEFNLKVVKGSGGSATAVAEADIRGNRIRKRFTLFAGSPLLEVDYQFEFANPELNVVGVNPLIKLGEVCDVNHIFYFPTKQGIEARRFLGYRMYGECFDLEEGWVAGYDEAERLTLITAFEVNKPFLIHLWMNTPQNRDSNYYYVEVQPWIRTIENKTNHFTYYLYGYRGRWEDAMDDFRRLGIPLRRTSLG